METGQVLQILGNALKVALRHILTDVEVRKDGVTFTMPTFRPPDQIQVIANRTLDIGRFPFNPEYPERTIASMLSAMKRIRSITTTPIKSITLAGVRKDCQGHHEHTIVFEQPLTKEG